MTHLFVSQYPVYLKTLLSQRVCLSVCSHILKTTRPNFTKSTVHATLDRGSVLFRRQCDKLCTFGFVDDVMFPYNGGNRSESKTTRMFRPVRLMASPVGRQTLFGRICRVAVPWAKSAVSDCILS